MASTSFVVRMKPGQQERPTIIGEAVRFVDPTLPVSFVGSMQDRVMASLASRRFVMRILGVFAAVALFMAALGLYGLISYSVAQRRQEIGIRMALGAGRDRVLRLVLLQGVRLALVGLGVGLAGSLAASRLLRSQLYEVSPFDPLTIAVVATALLGAAVLASYLPALSATRVDPLEALRYE
jgi:ABC-type antimicrobial peptide transport system permease subunit